MSEGTITIKKNDLYKYSTFLLVALVIVLVIVMMTGDKTGTGTDVAPTPSGGTPPAPSIVTVDESKIEGFPTMGDANAPVTILDFSDYLCGFCGRHHSQTLPLIKENYIDTGKVRYVFMDFISVGDVKMHEAAKCARELGGDEAFFEMSDMIYENQASLRTDGVNKLKGFADDLGLSASQFATCLDSGKHKAEVDASTAYGRQVGVSGTPGFIVNGRLVSGAQPYNVFEQAIEAGL